MYADARMTFRIPKEELVFAKKYARERSMSLTELVVGYIRRLKNSVASADDSISPGVRAVMGIVPIKDAEDERESYHEYLERKYA